MIRLLTIAYLHINKLDIWTVVHNKHTVNSKFQCSYMYILSASFCKRLASERPIIVHYVSFCICLHIFFWFTRYQGFNCFPMLHHAKCFLAKHWSLIVHQIYSTTQKLVTAVPLSREPHLVSRECTGRYSNLFCVLSYRFVQ